MTRLIAAPKGYLYGTAEMAVFGRSLSIHYVAGMKLAIITPDGLSTVLYARSFATVLGNAPTNKLVTISSTDGYDGEIAQLGSEHHSVSMARYVDPTKDLSYMWSLYRVLRDVKPDAVLTHTHKPNVYGSLAAWLARVPVRVATVRGLGTVFQAPSGIRARLVYLATLLLYRLVGCVTSQICFTNAMDRKKFIELGVVSEGASQVIGDAITVSEYTMEAVSVETMQLLRGELGIGKGDVVVLMVGRLIRQKGILEFIEAATLVRRQFANARFLLVAPAEIGAPDEVPVAEVQRLEQDGDFRWLGFRRDLRDIYSIIDIAVLPSWYPEGGYPHALLEPMSFGKPAIAADTDTCRNPVEPNGNGFWVPPKDAPALAKTIGHLVADPALRDRLGRRSRQKVIEEFDDLAVARTIADYIEHALKRHYSDGTEAPSLPR